MSWRAVGERADLTFIREILPDAGTDPFPRHPGRDRRRRPHQGLIALEDDEQDEDEAPVAIPLDVLRLHHSPQRGGTGTRPSAKSRMRTKSEAKTETRKRRSASGPSPAGAPTSRPASLRKALEQAALTPVAVDVQTGWAALVEAGHLQRALRARLATLRPATRRSMHVRQQKLPLGLPLTPCEAVLSSHLACPDTVA